VSGVTVLSGFRGFEVVEVEGFGLEKTLLLYDLF